VADRLALSKGELEVARVLWELGKASVREVHEALPDSRDVEFSTVQTYLRRLAAKGYVTARLDGRTNIYAPKVKPQTVIRETLDDLIDRLFGGETMPLMRHLIEDRGINDDELAQLRMLIERHERKKSDERSTES
jgi:BlaI family penicillinase repressor